MTDRTDNSPEIYTVTRLNREVRALLEGSFPMLWVRGEISNLARPASGHLYFSLKDNHAQVRCAMFKGRNRLLRFNPGQGMEVLLQAVVGLYEGRGEYQLVVEHMEPAGAGALQRAFEELKQRLNAEGLFDESHKLPLPAYPGSIGIISSATGAALRDVLTVLARRFPPARVIIYPVPVQGSGAAEQIRDMLKTAAARGECDVLILTRGGGSLEDLWAFNDEALARAIHACKIPVITGVGHEIDFTIADFVADRRAPTPSAAAELVSPDAAELAAHMRAGEDRLLRVIQQRLLDATRHTDYLQKRLADPVRHLQSLTQRLDELSIRLHRNVQGRLHAVVNRLKDGRMKLHEHDPRQVLRRHQQICAFSSSRLQRSMAHRLDIQRGRLRQLTATLTAVSPLATLDRGYAIVVDATGSLVTDSRKLHAGEQIRARLRRGEALAEITRLQHAEDD